MSVDKLQLYNEDDDTTTDNGKTLSSVVTITDNISHDSSLYEEEESLATFEKIMKDPENSRISKYRNTYFMDGGSRFISVSTLYYYYYYYYNLMYMFSYLLWVIRAQKPHHILVECLKIGFNTSYIIKTTMNVYPSWRIQLS